MDDHPWQFGFARGELRLSTSMRAALRTLVLSPSLPDSPSRSIAALARRRLCDVEGTLTPLGRTVAIELLPLREQCRLLRLPLEEREHEWTGRCEDAAADLYRSERVEVCAHEGRTLRALIHALVLPRLREAGRATWANDDRVRSYFYGSYEGYRFLLDSDPSLPAGILASVLDGSDAAFERSWATLAAWNTGLFSDHPAARLTAEKASRLLRVAGRQVLHDLLARELAIPGAFGSGWPDLTLFDADRGVELVEVKTTDRLHFAQIVTVEAMRGVDGLSVRVLRLRRPRRR